MILCQLILGRDKYIKEKGKQQSVLVKDIEKFINKTLSNNSPHLNAQGKINDWKKLQHPLKINSHLRDANGSRQYFSYRDLSRKTISI